MINLSGININDNEKIILIFFISIIFYVLIYLELNKVCVMILILLFFVFYDKFIKNTKTFFYNKKQEDVNYNSRIEGLLHELEYYEKLSPYKYKEAYNLWGKYIKTLNKLESEKLYNYTQYFDNAYLYLKESCNIFMGIIIGLNERKYIDGMDYGDFENTKELTRGSKIIKQLYSEGQNILYNLSLRLNKKWEENPNIHNKEIIINVPDPYDYKNKKKNNYDFF